MEIGTAIIIIGGGIFTYFTIYKWSKILGNILFSLIGLITMMTGNTTGTNAIGLMIFIGGIVNLIYGIYKLNN